MKSPLLTIHDEVLERLKETGRDIYDEHPQNVEAPYLMIDSILATDWSTKFESGQEVYVEIGAWSQYTGCKEVLELVDEVVRVMTLRKLHIDPAFNAVVKKYESTNIIPDIDGKWKHGVVRFKFLIEEC